MACSHPLRAYKVLDPKLKNPKTGKFPVFFSNKIMPSQEIKVPCGKCLGCKKERSTSWGVRCVHEAKMHKENCFLTLTYHPKFYPKDGMLNKKHFQDFMKRLRKNTGAKIRYIHCGEYGPKTFRAHYHALLFGYDFPDKVFEKLGKNEDRIFHSDLLEDTWKKGKCVIGEVSFASAQYVAKYINKGGTIQALEENDDFVRPYNTSSRRPGLGIPYLEKYYKDIYPRDYIIIQGGKYKVPRAYDKWLEEHDKDLFKTVKNARRKRLHEEMLKNNLDYNQEIDVGNAREQKMEFWKQERDGIN